MTSGRNFFDQPIKNDLRSYDNNWKIAIGEGNDCTIGWLLDCPYSKKSCKLIAIGVSKQQKIDGDLKAVQQMNFTWNLYRYIFHYWISERNSFRFFKRKS